MGEVRERPRRGKPAALPEAKVTMDRGNMIGITLLTRSLVIYICIDLSSEWFLLKAPEIRPTIIRPILT